MVISSSLADTILNSVDNVITESDDWIDEVLEGKIYEKTTSFGTRIYVGSGGYAEAKDDFLDFNEGEGKIYTNGTMIGQLPDGTKIIVRKESSDGRATLEIQRKKYIKIRYE